MDVSYERIPFNQIRKTLETTFDHCSGHVYPLLKLDDQLCVLVGHNAKYGNVASFGGFSEQYEGSQDKESLLETILREYEEESLECVTDRETLKNKIFEKSALITRKSPKGCHYTIFCFFDNLNIDPSIINQKFKEKRNDPNLTLTKGQLENDYVVCIPLNNIKEQDKGLMNDLTTSDFNDNEITIRSINMPAYRWLLSSDFLN